MFLASAAEAISLGAIPNRLHEERAPLFILPPDKLLALYGCCDVFLSLHRSEGFSRGIAEALQLGVDVIATAYGGNTDFCTGPLAHPVRCQEVPIPRGTYPCADGHVWGKPDLDHAAELMQQVAARRLALANDHEAAAADPSRDPAVLAVYRQRFSWAATGARYRARLEELWGQRQELAERLRRRAGDGRRWGWKTNHRFYGLFQSAPDLITLVLPGSGATASLGADSPGDALYRYCFAEALRL